MELLQLLPVPGLTELEAVLPQTNKAGVPDGVGEARGLYLQRSKWEPWYGDRGPLEEHDK